MSPLQGFMHRRRKTPYFRPGRSVAESRDLGSGTGTGPIADGTANGESEIPDQVRDGKEIAVSRMTMRGARQPIGEIKKARRAGARVPFVVPDRALVPSVIPAEPWFLLSSRPGPCSFCPPGRSPGSFRHPGPSPVPSVIPAGALFLLSSRPERSGEPGSQGWHRHRADCRRDHQRRPGDPRSSPG